MFDTLILLNRHKILIVATTLQALRTRFVANALGSAWLVLYPILFLSMYTVVFIFILGVRVPDLSTTDYVLTIFCGLIPFLAFSEALSIGSISIVGNRALVRNTLFPIEWVVARDVLVGHVSMGLGMLLVWASVVYQGHLYWTHLLVPVIYFFQILMALGIVWITATLTVFFRDLQQTIPLLILFLMLASPIGYTDAMVPENMKAILILNPLSWLMRLYRTCLLEGHFLVVDFSIFLGFSLFAFFMGYKIVSKLKPIFSDYV